MPAAKKIRDATEQSVRQLVAQMTDEEKKAVLVWSQRAVEIRSDATLSSTKKLRALSSIENGEVARIVLTKLFQILKGKAWTDQSWARRLGIAGAATGLTFGGASVGIATMGAGMGVPLIVMTAAGGVVLGAAIDEIKKELK